MGVSQYIRRLREKVGHSVLLLPAVSAIVLDEAGRVLLHRSSDDGKWYLIGGAMDPGEEPAEACVREVREETGLLVVAEKVVAVSTSPVVRYPNGDECEYVGITFLCRVVGGHLHVADGESLEVRFFERDELPELREDQRERLVWVMDGGEGVWFRT